MISRNGRVGGNEQGSAHRNGIRSLCSFSVELREAVQPCSAVDTDLRDDVHGGAIAVVLENKPAWLNPGSPGGYKVNVRDCECWLYGCSELSN